MNTYLSRAEIARILVLASPLLLATPVLADSGPDPGPKSGSDRATFVPGPPVMTPAEIAKLERAAASSNLAPPDLAPPSRAADDPGKMPEHLSGAHRGVADCAIYPLTAGAATAVTSDPTYTYYDQSHGYWAAVALRSAPGSDWDLVLYDREGGVCLDGWLTQSTYGAGLCDIVVGDYNHAPLGREFQESFRFSGPGEAVIEWDSGPNILRVNELIRRETGPGEVVEIWDADLQAGTTYTFNIRSDGHPDDPLVNLFLFQNQGSGAYFGGRSQAVFSLSSEVVDGTFTPSVTDWYGIAAVCEDTIEGVYELSFGLCTGTEVLVPGAVTGHGNGYEWFTGNQVNRYWMGFGMRSDSYARGFSRYNLPSGLDWPFCLGDLQQGYGGGGVTGVIFQLGDFNHMPTGSFYYRTDVLQGHDNDVQWNSGADLYLPATPPVVRSTGPSHVIEVWDVQMLGGETYNVDFRTSGAAALELYLVAPIAGLDWYDESNDFYNSTGSCGPARTWPTEYCGLAIVNHNGGTGNYQFQFDYPVKETTPSPLNAPINGRGVAWADVDSDGDDDLFVMNYGTGTPNRLYRNQGGLTFVEAAPAALAGLDDCLMSRWADLDNDGDSDVLLAGGRPYVFRNDGFPVFTNITPASFPVPPSRYVADACWLDYNGDGILDIALVETLGVEKILLYRGLGGGSFTPVGPIGSAIASTPYSLSWADYDNDRDPDLYLAVDGINRLYRNNGNGSFTDVTLTAFPGAPSDNSYGGSWADPDHDRDLDLYVSNAAPSTDILWRNGGGVFTNVSSQLPAPISSRGTVNWIDVDNDWLMDLHVARFTNTGHQFLYNLGTIFSLSANPAYNIYEYPGGVAYGDPDADGDLDAFVASNSLGGPATGHFLRNDLCPGNHWLDVVLEGVTSNRSALGARVTAYVGWLVTDQVLTDNAGLFCQNARTIHFGFRYRTPMDSLVIDWPSGVHQVLVSPPIDTRLHIQETHGIGVAEAPPAPLAFALLPAIPNPFQGSTELQYDLPYGTAVTLRIYDVAGRLVRELVGNANRPAGRHSVMWDGTTMSGVRAGSGIYFVRLEAGDLRVTRRLVQLR